MIQAREWIGKRVATRTDSGWGHIMETGVVEAEAVTPGGPWFFFAMDMWRHSALAYSHTPMLAHTNEFYSPEETAWMTRVGLLVGRMCG